MTHRPKDASYDLKRHPPSTATDPAESWTCDQFAANEIHLREIINAVADPIFVKDREHRWVMLNDACCEFIGRKRSELLGKSDFQFFPEEQAKVFWDKDEVVFTTGQSNVNEEYFTDSAGVLHTILTKKTLYTDSQGRSYIVGVIRDITERKRAEAELRQKDQELFQSRRLEAVGRLVAGVAHDFNNLLAGVLGITEDVRHSMGPDDHRRADLDEVRKSVERAFAVTKQLLTFGPQRAARSEVLDTNAEIRDFGRMMQRLIGEQTQLALELTHVAPINLDKGHLQQVLMNLVLNSRDALLPGGKIVVSTGMEDLAPNHKGRLGAADGRYVRVSVHDNGAGMDETTLARMFDPFYTTKAVGYGTGLGLATVLGIVKQNHGEIQVGSVPGKGTQVDIYFPPCEWPNESSAEVPVSEELPQSGTILLVEDEDIVRKVVSNRLLRQGYRVLQARSGEEALSLLDKMGRIDLLLTDVVMTGMNGKELAERVQDRYPGVAVLYMSGYPANIIASEGLVHPGIQLIDKSDIFRSLSRRVREALKR